MQDLLKKLKTTKNFSENALVLDPDLIDLTMIPPPMTPDEVCKKTHIAGTNDIPLQIGMEEMLVFLKAVPILVWKLAEFFIQIPGSFCNFSNFLMIPNKGEGLF